MRARSKPRNMKSARTARSPSTSRSSSAATARRRSCSARAAPESRRSAPWLAPKSPACSAARSTSSCTSRSARNGRRIAGCTATSGWIGWIRSGDSEPGKEEEKEEDPHPALPRKRERVKRRDSSGLPLLPLAGEGLDEGLLLFSSAGYCPKTSSTHAGTSTPAGPVLLSSNRYDPRLGSRFISSVRAPT